MRWDPHQLIGQVLQDTYRIEGLIGKGGMGAIYEAAHLRLNRRFAVKLLDERAAKDQEALARFKREALITSALGHPNILEVTDFNQTAEGLPFLVMELLDGEDLATRIAREKRLGLLEAAAIFHQVASALETAHQKGIIHRDLKPQNIFLCRRDGRDDFVKVLDFGVSKMISSETQITKTTALLGTPVYMSPEQAEQTTKLVDHRADIHAMGAILYEMLAGQPPFMAETLLELLGMIIYIDAPPIRTVCPEVPEAVEAVLQTALRKKRKDRFSSMAAFSEALSRAIGAAPARSTTLSAAGAGEQRAVAVPSTGPRRRLLAGAAIGVILAAAVVVVLCTREGPTAPVAGGGGPSRRPPVVAADAAPRASARSPDRGGPGAGAQVSGREDAGEPDRGRRTVAKARKKSEVVGRPPRRKHVGESVIGTEDY